MSDESETNDLTPEERHALAALASDRTYFRGLEDRTVAALQREGLIRASVPAWMRALRWTAAAASLAAAFGAGAQFQKHREPSPESVVIPASTAPSDGPAVAVTYHLDLEDPFDESFSDADAHPKVRISRALALQTQ
ncbi:MAG: hypothetical protein R3E12_11920 [Candidatus Eisenbacteria bacterium]|uniref:Uncharacterized protein n=1 Tax=Eiseniibacteriota bacterium TaxID=2212470 RepID=A0A956RMN4_UNCEI|nr:hypothetical protein [Candidatus Eisenbacteria bacterium]